MSQVKSDTGMHQSVLTLDRVRHVLPPMKKHARTAWGNWIPYLHHLDSRSPPYSRQA